MRFSPVVPLLALGLTVAMAVAVHRMVKGGQVSHVAARACFALIAILVVWGVISSAIAAQGLYLDYATVFLMGAGVLAPFILAFTLGMGSPNLRRGLQEAFRAVPLSWLTYIHAVRLLAVGTITKYIQGSLPGHFILFVGVPDFLIGLTAPVIGYMAFQRRALSRQVLAAWHLIGALVYLPALPLMHLSVPSPIQVYVDGPTTAEVLSFPMALVPSFVVPLLLGFHFLALAKLSQSDYRAPCS